MHMKSTDIRPRSGRQYRGLVSVFVDARQRQGRYCFTDAELAEETPQSTAARRGALGRLRREGRLVRPLPRHHFFVIVPHEHHSMGAPPLAWYLDPLMRFLGVPDYYVGLLTAAQWYGASHFAVQETQVMVPRQLRAIQVGRERVRFITKVAAARTPVEVRNSESGTIRVSTPEATAVDLVRYLDAAGGFNMIATVLTELAPRLRPQALRHAAILENDVATAQRLGWLLDHAGANNRTATLAHWIARQRPRARPLDPRAPVERAPLDKLWQLWLNTTVEVSL
jgi:predicted transcriptional regulator of viral defense system